MDAKVLISQLADSARAAGRTLSTSTGEQRKSALNVIADAIEARSAEILAANQKDMEAGRASALNSSLLDRLLLTPDRVKGIANGARQVSQLPDPLGNTLRKSTLPNGIELEQISVPFGVIGMVYEARPNVTVDAAVILLMSGNAALLRGSSSAAHSNEVLVRVMRDALASTSISPDVIQLVPSEDRETVKALLNARGKVDLVIPRGSAALIRMVVDESSVPTIETGAGVCHVYIDEFADLSKAVPIIVNSKVQRPSALKALHEAGVILHCDSATLDLAQKAGIPATQATDENFSTEYGTLEMNVAIVDSVDAASAHIAKYGTQHTEAIVSENKDAVKRFIALADCAAVMVNTSTRFTDGEQMGFGAEIGISNQKLHARGPMGLEAMTTTTWIVTGNGQIRS